ncbi:MAG: hypothetical protein EPN84_01850 [Legionella sp.]|nr:MAG: hypothetical protein EPN84_01850 [Legionella sp.]
MKTVGILWILALWHCGEHRDPFCYMRVFVNVLGFYIVQYSKTGTGMGTLTGTKKIVVVGS